MTTDPTAALFEDVRQVCASCRRPVLIPRHELVLRERWTCYGCGRGNPYVPPQPKALSVRQPWAELVARGDKTVEVRSWGTDYRGPLVICSAAAWHATGVRQHGELGARGVSVCVVDLVDVRPLTLRDGQATLGYDPEGDVERGLLGWVLARPRRLPPIPVKGKLSLFAVPADVAALI